MDTPDPVLAQLKKLREGRGLTADRLGHSPAVLSALNTNDQGEAFQLLQSLLDQMDETDRVRALRVDFGLDLPELLQSTPKARERAWLGDRRSGYSVIAGKDVKTLARWSDRAIGELRNLMLTDQFDGHIVVTAGVKDRRVAGIEVLRYDRVDEELSHGRATGYTNPEPGPSLPLVLYAVPPDWRPASLRFAVAFLDEVPEVAWALVAEGVPDVGFGHERTELTIYAGLARCLVEEPRGHHLYGVWWGW